MSDYMPTNRRETTSDNRRRRRGNYSPSTGESYFPPTKGTRVIDEKDYDLLQRLMAVHDKLLAEGPEALTEEDKAVIEETLQILKPMIDAIVAAVSELADRMVSFIYEVLNAIPPEIKAHYLQDQTARPVGIAANGGIISGMQINSIHDHVDLAVGDLNLPHIAPERMEQRWR